MNTIRPNYPQQTQGYQTKQGSTDKDGHNQNAQDQQQRRQEVVARGRVQDVQNKEPIVNQRQAVYSPAANAYPKASFNNRQTYAVNTPPIIRHSGPTPMQYQNYQQTVQQPVNPTVHQEQAPSQPVRSNRINIAQILKDFRNTIKAIATPREIEDQVNKYLEIVNQQVRSERPQVNLIQSNLKIAASLLDKYISETLNKDSKVVQNWLDALFLQKIDYFYNENDVNPSFLVKFPDENNTKPQEAPQPEQEQAIATEQKTTEQPSAETELEFPSVNDGVKIEPEELTLEEEYKQAKQTISQKPNITIIPQDTKLKSLFVEAKKHAFNNNPQKAMAMFREAFSRATELNDNETQSRICLEIGKIYDDNDHFVQALNSYNKSLQYTTDVNVKSRAHFSMAQIYDDVNQIEPAMKHYLTSISYAGKSDDLIGQSDSLTKMANILTDKYDDGIAFKVA